MLLEYFIYNHNDKGKMFTPLAPSVFNPSTGPNNGSVLNLSTIRVSNT